MRTLHCLPVVALALVFGQPLVAAGPSIVGTWERVETQSGKVKVIKRFTFKDNGKFLYSETTMEDGRVVGKPSEDHGVFSYLPNGKNPKVGSLTTDTRRDDNIAGTKQASDIEWDGPDKFTLIYKGKRYDQHRVK